MVALENNAWILAEHAEQLMVHFLDVDWCEVPDLWKEMEPED
jgi:hypothetical protein